MKKRKKLKEKMYNCKSCGEKEKVRFKTDFELCDNESKDPESKVSGYVQCDNCKAMSTWGINEKEAIKYWNRRTKTKIKPKDYKGFKPCPFCGETNSVSLGKYDFCDPFKNKNAKKYVAVCNFNDNGCGGSSGNAESINIALYNWNKRP